MSITSTYYRNVIKRDLINKCLFTNIKNIPNIEMINFNFNFNFYNYNLLLSGASALKILCNQTFSFIKAKTPNKQLRLKKGAPIGCKVSLRKLNMFIILNKLIKKQVFLKINNLIIENLDKKNGAYNLKINNIFIFNDFRNHYYYFSNLFNVNINVVFSSNTKNFHHTLFIIKSFNIK